MIAGGHDVPLSFLFASFGSYGTLMPLLTGARQLRAKGHRVRVLVEPAKCSEVEAAGFESSMWRRAPTDPDDDVAPFTTLQEWLGRVIFHPAAAYAADTMDEISRIIRGLLYDI